MAQGDLTLFEAFSETIGDGSHDLDTNTFIVMLITEQVGGVAEIAADDNTPDSGDYTEIADGNGYTSPGETLTMTWGPEAAGACVWADTGGTITWSQNGSGAANIKTALIYNASHGGSSDAVGFIDMTADGTTAISLVDGDITLTITTVFTGTVA